MSVRYGARHVGFETPAPRFTKRRHETPAKGDTQSAIIRASGGCLDFNLQAIKFKTGIQPVGAHWAKIGQNGFTHYAQDGKLHKLTRRQKRMTIQTWVDNHGGTVKALNMLRKRGGRRTGKRRIRAINDYPMTWKQAVKFADRCDTVLTPELKSIKFALEAVAKDMATVCATYNYPLWPMTLLKMKKAREKCAAFVSQGYEFALIFGKFRSQARGTNKIKGWEHKPTVIWGPASARAWLRS